MADEGLLQELASGERRPLARLLTRIEAGDPSLRETLPALFAAGRGAHLVGITGPPGSGKSTLVNALIAAWRAAGKRVGVLAVDPSSPYTGGAIMGDRIRMMEHAADRDVFMRSMASRGELGGLAGATWLAAAALDAAGYDPIVIETVGAGQSEVEVARLAETTVVVEVPDMGDEVQAIKAGLLEVADVIVVNKGDRPGADRAARQLRAMLSTAGGRVARKPPPVLVTDRHQGRRGGQAGRRRSSRIGPRRARPSRREPAPGTRCAGHCPTRPGGAPRRDPTGRRRWNRWRIGRSTRSPPPSDS